MNESSIQKLKLRSICPILAKNNWSFFKEADDITLLREFIHIAICWLGKRGRHISWEVLEATLLRKVKNLDTMLVGRVNLGLRKFYQDHYLDMSDPLSRQRLEINFDMDGTLYMDVPIIDQKKKAEFILLDNINEKSLLTKNWEVRFISLWTTLTSNHNFIIKNINISNNMELTKFNPTGSYIESCRTVLRSMLKSLSYKEVYPPEEICKACSNLTICPV